MLDKTVSVMKTMFMFTPYSEKPQEKATVRKIKNTIKVKMT